MPIPEKYRRQLMETTEAAEREGRWDGLRAWLRATGEVVLWTLLGMAIIFEAFHVNGVAIGRVYWLIGCIVWVGGVSKAVLGAYRRGVDEGRW
jgi:hypothetical protein